MRNAQHHAAILLYGRISGVRVLVAWWVAGWTVGCGGVVSKESGARLREWGCGVGSWQGQGRSQHFTKVRISIQLLAVEGVCSTCVELCPSSQLMTTVTATRKQWKVVQLIFCTHCNLSVPPCCVSFRIYLRAFIPFFLVPCKVDITVS